MQIDSKKIRKGLLLRALANTDVKDMAKCANNEEISKFLNGRFPFPYSLDDAKYFIEKVKINLGKDKPCDIVFAIEFNGRFAGVIGLHKISYDLRNAEIGYWLGSEFWGKGIMSSVVSEIVTFGFNELNLKRIVGYVFLSNVGSKKVLEKNKFELEGIAKNYAEKDGKFLDMYQLAIVN